MQIRVKQLTWTRINFQIIFQFKTFVKKKFIALRESYFL